MRAFSRFRPARLAPALLAVAVVAAGSLPSRGQDAVPPGVAQDGVGQDTAKPPAPEPRAVRLDRLFAELKREPDADKASDIANRIQAAWLESGSATVDLLMERASQAVSRKDAGAALDLVDQAIVLAPTYAEAYNRRATLYYTQNRYALSMRDVEETLRLEPRHFGALTGLGAMLEELGRDREALDAYTRALALYPALKAAQDAAARIAEELSGDPA